MSIFQDDGLGIPSRFRFVLVDSINRLSACELGWCIVDVEPSDCGPYPATALRSSEAYAPARLRTFVDPGVVKAFGLAFVGETALFFILHVAVLSASCSVASRRLMAASNTRLRTLGSEGG